MLLQQSDSHTCWEPLWGVAMAGPGLGPLCSLLAGQSSKQDCKTFKNTGALFPWSAARQYQALTCGSHSRWKEGVPTREKGEPACASGTLTLGPCWAEGAVMKPRINSWQHSFPLSLASPPPPLPTNHWLRLPDSGLFQEQSFPTRSLSLFLG